MVLTSLLRIRTIVAAKPARNAATSEDAAAQGGADRRLAIRWNSGRLVPSPEP